MYNLKLRPTQQSAQPLYGDRNSLFAESGSFSIAGADTTFEYHSPGEVDPAAFVITGYDAILALGPKTMAADLGAFTISGSDATVWKSFNLNAWGADFRVEAPTVTFFYVGTNTLNAESGEFSVSFYDSTEVRTRVLLAMPRALTISGYDASLLNTRKLGSESGVFLISGSDASLLWGAKILANSGSFVVAGSDAEMLRGLKLDAEPGSFLIAGFPAVNGSEGWSDAPLVFIRTATPQTFIRTEP